jgi:hypothetical protein
MTCGFESGHFRATGMIGAHTLILCKYAFDAMTDEFWSHVLASYIPGLEMCLAFYHRSNALGAVVDKCFLDGDAASCIRTVIYYAKTIRAMDKLPVYVVRGCSNIISHYLAHKRADIALDEANPVLVDCYAFCHMLNGELKSKHQVRYRSEIYRRAKPSIALDVSLYLEFLKELQH